MEKKPAKERPTNEDHQVTYVGLPIDSRKSLHLAHLDGLWTYKTQTVYQWDKLGHLHVKNE